MSHVSSEVDWSFGDIRNVSNDMPGGAAAGTLRSAAATRCAASARTASSSSSLMAAAFTASCSFLACVATWSSSSLTN